MAYRVALALLAALASVHTVALADLPARSGIAQALLGRWELALERLDPFEGADRATRYFRAAALLELGVRGEALTSLRSLSDAGGAFAGPALELAVSHLFDAGDHQAVVEWAASSRAERFQAPDGLRYRVGQSLFLLGRYDESRAELEGVLSGPFRPYALHSLGLIHFAQGRPREAVGALGSGMDDAVAAGDSAVASALTERLRLTRARVLYQVSTGAESLDEDERRRLLELAREQFERIESQSPLYPDALRGRGWCEMELGRSAQALAAFEAAADLDSPGRHEDLWAQGRVYQRLGYYDEAARSFARAREAAETEAAAPAGRGRGPSAERAAWEIRVERVGEVGERVQALEERADLAMGALDARAARLEAARQRLDRLRARLDALADELRSMGENLRDYMDRIPASSLFPLADRNRIEALAMRQEMLSLHIARLEAAFSGIEASRRWRQAGADTRTRVETLWLRLQGAKADLARAQRAFLEALKRRVSDREAELARQIEALRGAVASLKGRAGEVGALLTRADAQLQALRSALGTLAKRTEALGARLDSLEERTRRQVRSVEEAAVRRWAQRLLLRADAYALDEAQALHLWQETAGPEEEGEGR